LAFIPETKGQSLEEIERKMLNKPSSASGNKVGPGSSSSRPQTQDGAQRDRLRREQEMDANARKLERTLGAADDVPSVDVDTPPSLSFRLPPIVVEDGEPVRRKFSVFERHWPS
jgi:hypothetical protein